MALAAGLLERDDPAAQVTGAVARALDLAATWTAWDGRPLAVDDRVHTPHKAIRRIADHLVDHLAELEARMAGREPQPDHWHASATTTPADLAPFTAEDLDEARSRLVRLGHVWADRLGSLSDAQLDRSPGRGWSFRLLAAHVAGSLDYYAGAVGRPGAGAGPEGRE
nr:maleylpyruvate isomerase N-terminal domain-containing protein [Kitasatospora cineracea]